MNIYDSYLSAKERDDKVTKEMKKRIDEEIEAEKNVRFEAEKKHKEDMTKVKELFKQGKTFREIAKIMGYKYSQILDLRRECIISGTWLTEEEVETLTKLKNNSKKENDRIKKRYNDILKIKEMVLNGCTYKKIEEEMGYSLAEINNLIKQAIIEGIWVNIDNIKNKQEEIEKRVKEDNLHAEEEKATDEKLKKIYIKNKKNSRFSEKEKKEYEKQFQDLFSRAILEDKKEENGYENTPVKARKEFIEFIRNYNEEILLDISKKEITLIINILYYFPELANSKVLKFIITYSLKLDYCKYCLEIIKDLKDILEKTKYKGILVEYEKYVKQKDNIRKILVLKEKGMSNEEIARKFDMTSAEVALLINNDSTDFPFNENR